MAGYLEADPLPNFSEVFNRPGKHPLFLGRFKRVARVSMEIPELWSI
jgi:hypothetical protein